MAEPRDSMLDPKYVGGLGGRVLATCGGPPDYTYKVATGKRASSLSAWERRRTDRIGICG